MALNTNALIDKTYFEQMWQGNDIQPDRLENFINAISTAFEVFCNRRLKERQYTYEIAEDDPDNELYYDATYAIFDAPPKTTFWFPTYPVATVTEFTISGNAITASTGYTADEGYMLYNRTGRLVYTYGFDFPYLQNVRVKWTGGYSENSAEMSQLKYLAFSCIKDFVNAPQNQTFESEKIGQYSYKTMPTYFMKQLQGLSPIVFSDLSKYRREAIG